MTFAKNVPINITGPSYQSRSKPLSSQQTKNFYHDIVEEGKDNYVMQSFPGLKFKSTAGSGDRGMVRSKEIGYRVSGEKLYSFNSFGVHTELADIPGTDRAVLSTDGTNIIIVTSAAVYQWNGSISTVTDTNIVGSKAVTFLNSQMIYTNDSLFTVADPNNPDSASGLNSASAESQPDDLVMCYAFQQSAYMIGKHSAEPWWNTGIGNPPLERIDGQIFEVGCSALHSIANTDEFLYWLGDDAAVYQVTGGSKNRVSSTAISHAIAGYSKIDDAIGQTFTLEGINFYLLTFPTENKTWCLNEELGKNGWFEISSGIEGKKWQGSSVLSVYNKLFVADSDSGNLYELDLDTLTNNSEILQRRRVTSSINGKLLGSPGSRIQMSRFEVLMETGQTVIDGQGDKAQIQFEVSYDGGNSWVSKGWGTVGRLGQFMLRVEMFNMDSFYDCIVRLTTSDPAKYTLYSAAADLRLAGR